MKIAIIKSFLKYEVLRKTKRPKFLGIEHQVQSIAARRHLG